MAPDRRDHLEVFLRECKRAPDDDTARLVLADWLQDHGDARGELVHLQVRRSRLAEGHPEYDRYRRREMRLLAGHCRRWLGPLEDRCASWTFWRGLVELEARADRFLTPELFALAGGEELLWVEVLKLADVDAHHLARLAGTEALDELAVLDLADNDIGQALPRLLEAPALGRWRGLELGGNRLGDRGAEALARCPAAAGLRELGLGRNAIRDAGARALAESPHLGGLRALDLRGNPIGPDGAEALRARFGAAVRLARG